MTINTNHDVMTLNEGDQPYGNPKFYEKEYLTAECPHEWHEDNDPDWYLKDFRITHGGKPLTGKWQVACGAWGYTPTAFTTDKDLSHDERTGWYDWLSNPITNPTSTALVDKVNTYLRDTCDFHSFVECLYIDRENRVIGVSLGS